MRRLDVAATLVIALLAFILSYSKLVGLAERAGYSPSMALLWPLIVDGLAVVATLGVLRLRDTRYAWFLLIAATLVSVIAAVASAMFPAGMLPPVAAAIVSVVPPLCLLAAPHLAVQLMRDDRNAILSEPGVVAPVESEVVAPKDVAPVAVERVADVAPTDVAPIEVAPIPTQLFAVPDRRTEALRLIAEGMSQRAAAKQVGVSDTTVRRWRKQAA